MSFPTAVQKTGLAGVGVLSMAVAAVVIAVAWIVRRQPTRADRVERVRSNTNPVMKESAMAADPQKPPRNRDQEQPPRKGDTIEPTIPAERGQDKRERNVPLPEEETYEREPMNPRRSNVEVDE